MSDDSAYEYRLGLYEDQKTMNNYVIINENGEFWAGSLHPTMGKGHWSREYPNAVKINALPKARRLLRGLLDCDHIAAIVKDYGLDSEEEIF